MSAYTQSVTIAEVALGHSAEVLIDNIGIAFVQIPADFLSQVFQLLSKLGIIGFIPTFKDGTRRPVQLNEKGLLP